MYSSTLAHIIKETKLHNYSEEQILGLLLRKDDWYVANEGLLYDKYNDKIESGDNVLFHHGKAYLEGWKPELVEKYKLLLEGSE